MNQCDSAMEDVTVNAQCELAAREPNNIDSLSLTTRQQALIQLLSKFDKRLSSMYVGSLQVLHHSFNPERHALCAHGLREMMEKLPNYLDVNMRASKESLTQKIQELSDYWTRCNARANSPLDKEQISNQFLQKLRAFFSWFQAHHPSIKNETANLVRSLESVPVSVPHNILDVRVDKWRDIRDYFVAVSHHRRVACHEEFLTWLSTLEEFILDRCSPRTFDNIGLVDDVFRRCDDHIDSNAVDEILTLISKDGRTYDYFFDSISNAKWLQLLSLTGFFKNPPLPEIDGDYISFPAWPESRCLMRLAPKAPREVCDLIMKCEHTENPRVIEDFVHAGCAMPAGVSVELLSLWAKWAHAKHNVLLVSQTLADLAVNLAQAGEVAAGLQLIRAVIDVRAHADQEDRHRRGRRPHGNDPQPYCDMWLYKDIMQKQVPELVSILGAPMLDVLCDVLQSIMDIYRAGNEIGAPADGSYALRPAVEDHEQNREDLIGIVVRSVRDTASCLVRSKKIALPGCPCEKSLGC